MGVFDQFPYTNFHELNLDYILKRVKELETEVQELTELLETGPVADVKTIVNGASTSIKNGSGVANLPAASDTTAGVVNLDAVSNDVLRISGTENFEVPILDNGMISADQLPPTVEPATDRAFGTVKLDKVSDDVLRISGVENFNVPILDNGMISADQLPPTVGPATDAVFGTVKLDDSTNGIDITGADGTLTAAKLDSVPVLDANGDIDPAVLPASGVTAGTYGSYPVATDATYKHIFDTQVGADGRITRIYQNPMPFIRTDVTSIAAGSVTQSIYFDTVNYPWYNNACFINVNVYQLVTSSKGGTYLQALVPGTDYNWNVFDGYMNVTLTSAKSSTVYICVNGSFGRRGM